MKEELTKQDILKLFAESDARFEKRARKLDKQIGELTGTWGKFVEELVAPNSVELFKQRGIEATTTVQRIEEKRNGKPYYQIDLLLYNDTYVVVVEVKSTLKVSNVDEHLERLEKIQKSPPKRINLRGAILLGAVAGIIIEEDADKYAYKKGLYVLRQKGNIVEIANDENFRPREWKVD